MQSTIQPQQEMKTKDMTTLHLRKSIGFLIPLAFVCFALSPAPKAFGVRPPPDGGYSGNNTAEGTHALFSLTTGVANTAVGFSALFHNTIGGDNTATGGGELRSAPVHDRLGNARPFGHAAGGQPKVDRAPAPLPGRSRQRRRSAV